MMSISGIDRIVGHATLDVDIDGGALNARFKVLNDPRFIEAIVIGKKYHEIPSIVSRICGPCSISHTITAIMAVEKALGISVPEPVKILRKIAVLGEVAENHLLHLTLVVMPEYFGYDDLLEVAKYKPESLRKILLIRSQLSKVMEMISGRLVHPSALSIGGFTKIPGEARLDEAKSILKEIKSRISEIVELFLETEFPEFEVLMEACASLKDGYLYIGDEIITSDEREVRAEDYKRILIEDVQPYTTSKSVTLEGMPVYVGPRARVNLKADLLSDQAKSYLKMRSFPLRSPFDNLRAQAIELIHCIDAMQMLIEDVASISSIRSEQRESRIMAREGAGVGVSEAPRGLLIHHYEFNRWGNVIYANVITPTTINSRHVEVAALELIRHYFYEDVPVKEIERYLRKLVQAFDPCLGCATHSVKINIRGLKP
ncbi:MAG: nickel-dependent hydrogenase large subunit [Nitrososphaerota archaeon]